ncbi:MAG: cardiolipin synthase [Erysipelotrichaceae bacterium]|nr:cardiolipin synthase [Erysipelotrichaceae bacterium]
MIRLARYLIRKRIVVAVMILSQLAFLMIFVYSMSQFALPVYSALIFLSVIVVIYIVNRPDNPSYKLSWAILILVVPIVGGVLYLVFGGKKIPKALRKEMVTSSNVNAPFLIQDPAVLNQIRHMDPQIFKQINYLWRNCYFPVYKNTQTEYFAIGEAKFEAMKRELKKAERYIFVDYFIVKQGLMWNSIQEILVENVKEGVDVRLIDDDFGSTDLPRDFASRMNSLGIKTFIFNPLKPLLAILMNNRDHRKICVIDGKVGFVGGINLSDEYINVVERFGHWKDTAVMIKVESVLRLTVMFLTFYNYLSKENEDILQFKNTDFPDYITDGFVQPYSDSPTDEEQVGETVHMNIINLSKRYVYIMTPYLIIGYEMQKALITAAKNGIDVRLMVPHIPDKWYVHAITKSNYEQLIKGGVRIFEYEPGFMHAKTLVADDEAAIIGTTNMDFRSYYMHFECGILFIESKVISDLKDDFLQTQKQCIEITMEDCLRVPTLKRWGRAILNLFSALL